MITGEIIQQVFSIRTSVGSGSAFTIQIDGKQYLVTARHVLDGDSGTPIPKKTTLEVRNANQWHSMECDLIGVGNDPYDIAILALLQALAHFDEIAVGVKGVIYS